MAFRDQMKGGKIAQRQPLSQVTESLEPSTHGLCAAYGPWRRRHAGSGDGDVLAPTLKQNNGAHLHEDGGKKGDCLAQT